MGRLDNDVGTPAQHPDRTQDAVHNRQRGDAPLNAHDVVSGRCFTPAERAADAGVVVVSETLARQLWPNGDGAGQLVRLDAPQPASSAEARSAKVEPSRTFTVVGASTRTPAEPSTVPPAGPAARDARRRTVVAGFGASCPEALSSVITPASDPA